MTYVGQRVPSLTNTRLVAGRGTFVDDITLPDMTYLAFLRSPYAHARIRSIDTTRREALPGVVQRDHRRARSPRTRTRSRRRATPREWARRASSGTRSAPTASATSARRSPRSSPRTVHGLRRRSSYIDVDYEELPVVADPEEAHAARLAARRARRGATTSWSAATSCPATPTRLSRRPTAIDQRHRPLGPHHRRPDRAARVRRLLRPVPTTSSRFWDSTQNPHPLRYYLAETLRHARDADPGRSSRTSAAASASSSRRSRRSRSSRTCRRARPPGQVDRGAQPRTSWPAGHSRDTRFHYEAAYKTTARSRASASA